MTTATVTADLLCAVKNSLESWHMPLMLTLRRQTHLCEFEASLAHGISSRIIARLHKKPFLENSKQTIQLRNLSWQCISGIPVLKN